MRRCLLGSGRRDIAGARQKPSRISGYYRNNRRSGGSGRAFNDVLLRPQQFTYDQSVMASSSRIYRRIGCRAHRLFTGIQKWRLHISAGAYRNRIFNVGAGDDYPVDDQRPDLPSITSQCVYHWVSLWVKLAACKNSYYLICHSLIHLFCRAKKYEYTGAG